MNMDGTGVSPVTNNRSVNILPAWGPGGAVMYTSFANGNPDLVSGSGGNVISSQPGLNSGGAMRPGGGEIAVTLTRDGNAEIYIINPSGGILRRCTENSAEDVSASWSPDGSQIAFVSDRSGGPQIFVMNADCSNQRRVTFRGSYNTTPDWSPRGDLIAFTGRDGTRQDIFTVEPGTGFVERLTQDQGDNEEPSWSPDGNYLVFSSNRGGRRKLYIMPASGFPQVEIPAAGSGYEQPAWQR
jgi:TolB protein